MIHPSPLERYLKNGDQLLSDLKIAVDAKSLPLKVTTCGLLKAGKSSLLNALTDHLDGELFATGSVRTTTHNQTLSHKGFTFVDTPGLDATGEDDDEAWKGIRQSDVMLFVHHPGTGELHKDEVNFLVEVSKLPEFDDHLEAQLVVVLTHLDSNSEVIDGISHSVLHQIEEAIQVSPQIFHISMTSYKKGMLQQKPKLVEYSGVPKLRTHIVNTLGKLRGRVKSDRQRRVNAKQHKLINAIDEQINSRLAERQQYQDEIVTNRKAIDRDLKKFIDELRCKLSTYDDR